MSNYNNLLQNSLFFNKNLIKEKNEIKLNIACGPNIFPFDGWINYDRANLDEYFNHIKKIANEMNATPPENYSAGLLSALKPMPQHQLNFVNFLKNGGQINYNIQDLKSGFSQHPDNSVSVIYLGQMIEHLNPIYEVKNMLRECYRMLVPGGVIRITTPDLDLLIKAYINNEMDKFASEQPDFYKNADSSAQLAYLMYGACGPNCSWDNYEGHMFLYTQKSMSKLLEDCGFKNITYYYETGKSLSKTLEREVYDAGMSHSFIVECVK